MDDLNYTLQISLSPGDIEYAGLTVPALIDAHRSEASEVLLVVDCCKPQRSKFLDPEQRFPDNEFHDKVETIKALAAHFKRAGLVDRIEELLPGDERIQHLAERYTGGLITNTHDCGGCGFMSYLLGIESVNTRYVLHYDADMLLYQKDGFSWAATAIHSLRQNRNALFATPRIAPPTKNGTQLSLHEERPVSKGSAGFISDWYSTRCFLLDKERLAPHLPLLKGFARWKVSVHKLLVSLLPVPRKATRSSNPLRLPGYLYWRLYPSFPRAPEILFFEHFAASDVHTVHLDSLDAYVLHPVEKNETFVEALPALLELIRANTIPEAQKGYADLYLSDWL